MVALFIGPCMTTVPYFKTRRLDAQLDFPVNPGDLLQLQGRPLIAAQPIHCFLSIRLLPNINPISPTARYWLLLKPAGPKPSPGVRLPA